MAQTPMFPAKAGSTKTTLSQALTDSDTSIYVTELSVFPSVGSEGGNLATIQNGDIWETCLYTAKSAASGSGYLTVTRTGAGHASSSGGSIAFESGTTISRTPTAYDHDTFKANIADHETRMLLADDHRTSIANPHLTPAANLIINGGFQINQRKYISLGTLAAGAYGHDRWKAGSSGGNYTFTQLDTPTQITIASGKSLIQIIESVNVQGGTYTLSWQGTATARFTKNSSTPSGAFAASPITITGQTANTNMNVEFGPGTVSMVKVEVGSVATPFIAASKYSVFWDCLPYYENTYYTYGLAIGEASSDGCYFGYVNAVATADQGGWPFGAHPVFFRPKRAVPTITLYSIGGVLGSWTIGGGVVRACIGVAKKTGVTIANNTGGSVTPTAGNALGHYIADAEI